MGSAFRSRASSLSTTSFIVGRREGSFIMHWVPMLLTDSGTLVGNSRDLFWIVTWKMICAPQKMCSQTRCRAIITSAQRPWHNSPQVATV